jgi:hypothetical protein
MRDAQIKSFRDRFLRLRTASGAPTSRAPSQLAVRTPMPSTGAVAPAAPAAIVAAQAAPAAIPVAPAADAPLRVVPAAPVLALAPTPIAVSVPQPEPTIVVSVAEPKSTIARPTTGPLRNGACTRVLVIASDRRFRSVAATLLTQRGYTVAVGGRGEDVIELAIRERADVVVIDASASLTVAAREAARLGSLRPRVEVVAVSDGSGHGLAALPLLPKWSSFDELFEAIDRVRMNGSRGRVTHVAR